MNDQIVLLLVIVGGLAGLALVGVAMWMMQQDESPQGGGDIAGQQGESLQQGGDSAGGQNNARQPQGEAGIQPASAPAPAADSPPLADAAISDSSHDRHPMAVAAAPRAESPPVVTAPARVNSLTTQARPESDQELMRLIRTREGGLAVELNGKVYRSNHELDSAAEQRLAEAAHELTRFLHKPAAGGAPPPRPALPNPLSILQAAPKAERPVLKVSLEEAAKMEVKPPTMDVTRQLLYLRDQQKKPEIQIKTVAEEIDEILQVMIIGTPLAQRGLKVSDSRHGAIFSLDGCNYESVDDLPEAKAREVVRDAIKRWDMRSG